MTGALPTWDQFVVTVLRVLADGNQRGRREIFEAVAQSANLTEEQKRESISSGQLKYENRIGWAITYLMKGAALARPTRARYEITPSGRELLAAHPSGIGLPELRAIEGFTEAWTKGDTISTSHVDTAALDPFELVEQGISQINGGVADELIRRLHAQEPAFFEQAVVDLVVAMGYGGADAHATRTQLSNDGGIDGIIDQDILGLSRVYVQAKRYAPDNSIGRPDVQSFVGALQGRQANHGVFITTSKFSSGAIEYVRTVPTRVVLIDGARLAKLMIRYRVGVQIQQTVQIVEIDEDFFE